MCCGSGGTQYVTNTTSTEPSALVKPYLEYGLQEAKNQYQSASPSYFPGSTVTPFAPQTEQALQLTQNRALQGSPLTAAAGGELSRTLGGDYLRQGNPYMQGAFDAAARPVTDAVNAQFAKSGRLNSGAYADVLSRNLGEISSQMGYQNYQAERGRMQSAIPLAQQLAQGDYADYAALAGVGQAREGQNQRELQDQINRFNFSQQSPIDKLARYQALISGGSFGQTGTSTQPLQTNGSANFLSGLSSIAGLGSAISDWF